MKIVKREVDKKRGVIQWTTLDERWYEVDGEFLPSSTWISSYYPKGIGYMKWLADKGWDEAEALKNEAGNRGSKVHKMIESLIAGNTVKLEEPYINPETNQPEEITPEEWEAVMSFADWWKTTNPEPIVQDITVVSKKNGYAGTIDLIAKIDGKVCMIDFKTSQSIWPSHEIQLSSYKHAYEEEGGQKIDRLILLQVGYRLNKRKHKENEIEDCFDDFLAAKRFWKRENENVTPKQREFPLEIKL